MKFPIYDQGESFYLTSNWKVKHVDGHSFPAAFMGSPTTFALDGNNKSLAFIQCTAPFTGSLISSTTKLDISNFSSFLLQENRSQSKPGLIYSQAITISNCRSVVFTQNAVSYPHLVTSTSSGSSTTTTVNDAHGSVLHADNSLDISGIKKTLTFSGNTSLFGAAILLGDNANCDIHDNDASILFSSNHSSAAGGAIYKGSLKLENNNGPISFLGNTTLDNLSTVSSGSGSPTVTLPIGSGCGGAVCVGDGSVEISGNSSPILFALNSATGGAGAVYAKTFSMQAIAPVTFEKNVTAGNGGAISTSALTIEAEADVLFSNNEAAQGGAIYISKSIGSSSGTSSSLSLSAQGGDIVFSNNTLSVASKTRNSIMLNHDTTIQQIVAYGNSKIIFHDPIVQTDEQGTAVYTLNGAPYAVDSSTTYTLVPQDLNDETDILELKTIASDHSKTFNLHPNQEENAQEAPSTFATVALTTIPDVDLNKPSASNFKASSEDPTGYLIFSGRHLSSVESLIFQNYTSVLLANLKLDNGNLVVTDNARLRVLGLTTSGNGLLILGSGGGVEWIADASILPTNPNPALANLVINNLGCEALSFLSPDYSPAVLNARTQTVTLTGTVSLVSEDDIALYDNPILAKSTAFPFVTLVSSVASNGITMTNLTTGSIETEAHYGFQGQWSSSTQRPLQKPSPTGGIPPSILNTVYMAWETPNPNYVTYLLDPARRGELVPNSLWSSFSAMRTFSESLEETITREREGLAISIKGLGTISKFNQRNNHEGFSEKLGGYQTTLSMQYLDNTLLGISFGQLHGRIKSRPYDYKNTEHITLASILGRFPVLTRCSETRITWEACYAYTANRMKTDYTTLSTSKLRQSQGRWHNNSYYAQLMAEHELLERLPYMQHFVDRYNITGFLGAEVTGGWQQSFTETGDLIRYFERGKGFVITTPIGIRSEWHSKVRCSPVFLTVRATFRPDAVRVTPHTDMMIIQSKVTNSIDGVHLPRYGASLGCNGCIMLTRNASWSFDYLADIRKSASSHKISTGLQKNF